MAYAAPIDYAALRQTLSQMVQTATGLSGNQVIMAEPEGVYAPLPPYPFVTFHLTMISDVTGDDVLRCGPDGQWYMERDCTALCVIETFGRSHDEAYGLSALVHAAIYAQPTQEVLIGANVSLRGIGPVADLSALLETGFEGRTRFELTLGLTASLPVGLQSIEGVGIQPVVDGQPELTMTVAVP